MIGKKIYLKKVTIVCIVCSLVTSAVLAQDSEIQLLPTGRSLPDVLPRNEFVYVSPVDDPSIVTVDTPSDVPDPLYEPITREELPMPTIQDQRLEDNLINQIPPSERVDIPPDLMGSYPSENPIFIPSLYPEEVVEAPTAPPDPDERILPETPTTNIDMGPTDIVSMPPEEEIEPDELPSYPPSDDVLIPPEDAIAIEPSEGIPPSDTIVREPEEPEDPIPQEPELEPVIVQEPKPPVEPTKPLPTSEWKFTLNPTSDKYAPSDAEEAIAPLVATTTDDRKEQEGTKEVAASPPTREQDLVVSRDIITSLDGRYIQVASYHNVEVAKQAATTLKNKLSGVLTEKVVIYKPNNSTYYKVVVGPFQFSEIGVQLYGIRNRGYADAYTIK